MASRNEGLLERCLDGANVRLTFSRYTGYGDNYGTGALTPFRFRRDRQDFLRGTPCEN